MNTNEKMLSLGAESCGCFSYFNKKEFFNSEQFGDLLDDENFEKYSKGIINYLRNKPLPQKVLIDLHPVYKSSELGEKLGKRWQIPTIKIQHHLAHIHAVASENKLKNFIGLALDGTGLGFDGHIWGGEVFEIKAGKHKRLASLEEQILIGSDMAVYEPARVLLSVLANFLNKNQVYKYLKKIYTANEFELLYNQRQERFNCQLASSTGRIIDAAASLLFGINQRQAKHQATVFLEKQATTSYRDLEPVILKDDQGLYRLQTTPLFEYLIANLSKDKKRLAATVLDYLAQGFMVLVHKTKTGTGPMVAAGGLSKLKIISNVFTKNKIKLAEKNPAGDCGLAVGQIWAYQNLTNPGN